MSNDKQLINRIETVKAGEFDALAMDMYRFQAAELPVYRDFHQALRRSPEDVQHINDIPFLPISFFKSHRVAGSAESAFVFESSGTTGMTPSRHFVADISLYGRYALEGFRKFYGDPSEWTILALLPSYLERGNSSLVYMVQMLMEESGKTENGFYLHQFAELADTLRRLSAEGRKVLLFGVTFALLDFAEQFPMSLKGCTLIETGGMKGRKEEWTRQQVYAFLHERWPDVNIHSEYGMTELLSQAYAVEPGIYHPTRLMKALVRDINDPLQSSNSGAGVLNIIDLANLHSCSFIATEDIGRVYEDGAFEVLGRLDFAALRGCSLLAL
ncbi:MAG: acyl transferase [Chitinophagaceae bacterium]